MGELAARDISSVRSRRHITSTPDQSDFRRSYSARAVWQIHIPAHQLSGIGRLHQSCKYGCIALEQVARESDCEDIKRTPAGVLLRKGVCIGTAKRSRLLYQSDIWSPA